MVKYIKGLFRGIGSLLTGMKVTFVEYFTPKGRSINGEGVTPDLEVEYEPDEKDPEADNQLEAAAEAVKQAVE